MFGRGSNSRVPTSAKRTLKNIPDPIHAYRIDWRIGSSDMSGVFSGTPSLPDKPSVAVLPFINLSGDVEQEYFVDGITDDKGRRIVVLDWEGLTAAGEFDPAYLHLKTAA
jgi:hypothetical protein